MINSSNCMFCVNTFHELNLIHKLTHICEHEHILSVAKTYFISLIQC